MPRTIQDGASSFGQRLQCGDQNSTREHDRQPHNLGWSDRAGFGEGIVFAGTEAGCRASCPASFSTACAAAAFAPFRLPFFEERQIERRARTAREVDVRWSLNLERFG